MTGIEEENVKNVAEHLPNRNVREAEPGDYDIKQFKHLLPVVFNKDCVPF